MFISKQGIPVFMVKLATYAGLFSALAAVSCAPAVIEQTPEMPAAEPVYVQKISPRNFNEFVLGNELPVVVDFSIPGCRPCRRLAPIFEEGCREFYGKVKCFSFNSYLDDYATAESYGIDGYPTMIPFCHGEAGEEIEAFKGTGFSLDELRLKLEALIEECL